MKLTIISLTTALALAGCGGAGSIPPKTGQDVAAEIACVTNDLLSGVTSPAAVASDCKLATEQVAVDLIAQLLSFADKHNAAKAKR